MSYQAFTTREKVTGAVVILAIIVGVIVLGKIMESIDEARAPAGMEYHRNPVAGRGCVPIRTGGYYCQVEEDGE